MWNPIRSQIAAQAANAPTLGAPQGGAGFNSYAAGEKSYGMGRPAPSMGKIADRTGYAQRDAKAAARREALLRRVNSF